MPTPTRTTVETIDRILESLPAEQIGEIYCDEGAEVFFETMRPRIRDDGVAWASAIAGRLGSGRESGASLYVGAGLAELPTLLTEVLDLDRRVVVTNLREEECTLLNRALVRHGLRPRQLAFHPRDAADAAQDAAPFSHLSMVSVLSDPDTFPMISGLTYARLPPVQLDVAKFERERTKARALLDALFAGLAPGGWITTTAEEMPWLLDRASAHGITLTPDDEMLRTAIVGDPIGFVRWAKSDAPAAAVDS